jgi:predicted RNase H-like HicB family nuclease
MTELIDTLHVNVEYSTEDEEYGPVYVASFVEIRAVTDGQTLDEVFKNIQEVVELILEDPQEAMEMGVSAQPRVLVTVELPRYAQTA